MKLGEALVPGFEVLEGADTVSHGHVPAAAAYCRALGLVELVDQMVPTGMTLRPGLAVQAIAGHALGADAALPGRAVSLDARCGTAAGRGGARTGLHRHESGALPGCDLRGGDGEDRHRAWRAGRRDVRLGRVGPQLRHHLDERLGRVSCGRRRRRLPRDP